MTDREVMQQALEAMETCGEDEWHSEDDFGMVQTYDEDKVAKAITALKAALEQPEQQAEPVAWMYQHEETGRTAFIEMSEHKDGWKPSSSRMKLIGPLYTTPPQQQAEPVAMRMPRVGDRVICLEDESLGTVESLTAGGSPDIVFDDGSRGTYMVHEFAELFGYAEQRQQQAEPPPEWPLIKNILAVFGLDAIAFVAKWQAAQRPWVGLTDEEITELDMEISGRTMDECVRAIEDKLKEKNDH